jgi:hypothetical protein
VVIYKDKLSNLCLRGVLESRRFALAVLFLIGLLQMTACEESNDPFANNNIYLSDAATPNANQPNFTQDNAGFQNTPPPSGTGGNAGYSGYPATGGTGGFIDSDSGINPPSYDASGDATIDPGGDATIDPNGDATIDPGGDANDIPDDLVDLINDATDNPPDNTIDVPNRGVLDVFTDGTCCADGNCLCHGPDPTRLTSSRGPFRTATTSIFWGTVHYPTDAEPPFASVMVTGGFLNSGPEMSSWGTFYASWGIVTVIVNTTPIDIPHMRAGNMMNAMIELEAAKADPSSPFHGQLTNWYGVSGYSMGGGGAWICGMQDDQLKTSVSLAGHHLTAGGALLVATGTQVPSLMLCGSADNPILGGGLQSQSVYDTIPADTPKMIFEISGASHMVWFGPTQAGRGASGEYALAFQKVFLENDERWKPLLLQPPSNTTDFRTNIQ